MSPVRHASGTSHLDMSLGGEMGYVRRQAEAHGMVVDAWDGWNVHLHYMHGNFHPTCMEFRRGEGFR